MGSLLTLLNSSGGVTPIDPRSIPSLRFWWSSKNSTIGATGGLVDSVSDLSGNNITGAGVTTTRMTLTTDSQGRPVFDSQQKRLDASSGFTNLTEETVIVVADPELVDGSVRGLWGNNSTTNYGAWHTNSSPVQLNYAGDNSTITDGVQAIREITDGGIGKSRPIVYTFRRKAGTGRNGQIRMDQNGFPMSMDTHNPSAASYTFRWGSRGAAPTNAMKGKNYEALHFNAYLTDAQCRGLEAYVANIVGGNILRVPAWCANSFPAVKRYAMLNDIASAFAMPGGTAYFAAIMGDSDALGYGLKSSYDAAFIKAWSDAFIYENNSGAGANYKTWLALNTTDTASANNKGRIQAEAGKEAAFAKLITERTGLPAYIMKYALTGSAVADTGDDNNWNIGRSTSNFPSALRRFLLWSINREVTTNGRNAINLGINVHIGPNDANNSESYGPLFEGNYRALLNYLRTIPGFENSPLACGQVWSSVPPRTTYIGTIRAAIPKVAGEFSNALFINRMNSDADTLDNTHANAATDTAIVNDHLTWRGIV